MAGLVNSVMCQVVISKGAIHSQLSINNAFKQVTDACVVKLQRVIKKVLFSING